MMHGQFAFPVENFTQRKPVDVWDVACFSVILLQWHDPGMSHTYMLFKIAQFCFLETSQWNLDCRYHMTLISQQHTQLQVFLWSDKEIVIDLPAALVTCWCWWRRMLLRDLLAERDVLIVLQYFMRLFKRISVCPTCRLICCINRWMIHDFFSCAGWTNFNQRTCRA